MKVATVGTSEHLEINMTPMIDACFQLIIFFMLSLRLYSPEGDFSIKMPLAAPSEGLPDETQTPPVRIRIYADKNGNPARIQVGQRTVNSFEDLRHYVREVAGFDRGPAATVSDAEVELDCDYNLKFENVIKTLTAVSGYLADDNKTVIRMIEKIKFAPMRPPKKPKSS